MDNGICLKELGISEYAWALEDIKNIICIFEKEKIPILGGDVYKIVNGTISRTYDSWYLNREDESYSYIKSYEKTISYISGYENGKEGEFIYSIIF